MINHYINRAITLAKQSGKAVKSNPNVGAVIVHDDKIIGEGYHERFGESHAEVNAIQDAISKGNESLLKSSTIYVTLEPCNHYGNTPPCCKAILHHGIPKVIIGSLDPTPKLQGKGANYLKQHGVDITVLNNKDSAILIRRFKVNHLEKRPYFIIKFAQSKDNFISKHHEQTTLTNQFTNVLTHKWRTEVDGILIGNNTLTIDNPKLTARNYIGDNPKRIVFDYNHKLTKDYHLLSDSEPLIVINDQKEERIGNKQWISIPRDDNQLTTLATELFEQEIFTVIIEGGANTICQFIKAGLWDEARVISCDVKLEDGIIAPTLTGTLFENYSISGDKISHFFKTS